ncbi:NAD(P)/FAD-dependent oxidoreductase [Roseomonas marmotae]|uniref:FAD-binding oxidoreductase n=1 Tax=Roseomonas marmotae TaxID=2768161 RepID=A0ABS3KHY6_9PROT|nr:FAD-binding oxidoreductase [Roseomonas marmotae]MBO1077055.1 FAD-binding oxidoreductase [Roseomonas marmotae]QTI82108.1 FAD-binding oxidoreductase [Roseomonas marmotae]
MQRETTARQVPRTLPRSLYAATARPTVAAPPLEGDRKASVAVIGGGFTGLSAALHLAEGGADVVLIEANEPGWGASGRNGGQVNPGLKYDPDQVEQDFGADLGKRMVAFSSNAPNVVFDLVRRHQIRCEARQGGTLRAAYAEKNAAVVRSTAEQCLRRGMPVELLERNAMRAVTGTDRYICAVRDHRGGSVNPLGYARGLAEAAQRAGATIHAGTAALSIQRQASEWAVRTPGGTLRAEKLVIATNAYTDDIWPRLRRSVVPVFSAIVATEPLPPDLAASILPNGASLYENGQITVYYRIDENGRLLMGGRSPMRDISDPGELSWLVRYTERLWPALKGVRWEFTWNGQLAVTTDHYPHLHEPAENVLICLGYNGRGVAMASAMGGELARRCFGASVAELNMPVTDLKEIPFHGLWRSAAAARILYGRIRDSLGL